MRFFCVAVYNGCIEKRGVMRLNKSQSTAADIGDYCKVFAFTAVVSQPIMASLLNASTTHQSQLVIGLLYDLVKYTAPAFIFGILYSMIRTHDHLLFDLRQYYRHTWSLLFVPSIWWTMIYLLFMPWLQQVSHWHNFSTFCWQFINGNAAPHLWYNSMMLQYIILVPVFWVMSRWVGHNRWRGLLVAIVTLLAYLAWLAYYDYYVFHGPHMHDWYLLDRLFVSFLIYAVYGMLAWQFRDLYQRWVVRLLPVIIVAFFAILVWTNRELFGFGFPVSLYNATYYKPSMTAYCLVIIALISVSFIVDCRTHNSRRLYIMHFVATYAHRAFLSNLFWEQLCWRGLQMHRYAASHPLLVLLATWGLTWLLSVNSAWLIHRDWLVIKHELKIKDA